jgi:hypothetical protein
MSETICRSCDGHPHHHNPETGMEDECLDCNGTGMEDPTNCVVCGDTHPSAEMLSPGPMCAGCWEQAWQEGQHVE